jgi:Mg-chelatase subunit ChlD
MTLSTWLPLLAIPVTLGLLVRQVRGKDWFATRKRRVIVTTGLALVALCVALCDPAVEIPSGQRPTVILIADDSPSMRTGQPWPQTAVMIRDATESGTAMGIVSFSGSAQVAVPPGSSLPTTLRDGAAPLTDATDIEQALRTAMALATDPAKTALVLYSDGYETSGHALVAAAEARERGFRLYCLPPAKPDNYTNVSLVDLRYPAGVKEGDSLRIRAAVRAKGDTGATVALHFPASETMPGPAAVKTITLRANTTQWVDLERAIPPTATGGGHVRATVEVTTTEGDDAAPEDNRWTFVVRVGDRKTLLHVYHGRHEALDATRPETAPSALALSTVSAENFPERTAALGDTATVVLHDVPAAALSAASKDTLATYVRDMGGGLVVLGGSNSFGLGGYSRTPLDDMLPVKSDPEDRPPVRTVVVLDHSASMGRDAGGRTKIALARDAVLGIAELLGQKDEASLIAFNHEHAVLATGVTTDAWNRLRDPLIRLRATGGTEIAPALEAALALLEKTPPKTADGKEVRRHVIVVSDGVVVGDDGREPFDVAALVVRATAAKITLSVVQTGRSGAWTGLRRLAEATGGRFHDISDGLYTRTGGNRLARILLDDLDLPVLETEPATITVGVRRPIWSPDAAPVVTDVPQHIVTDAKKRAAVHLSAGEKKRPILATWQYGLGRVVAWPVPWTPGNRAWLESPAVKEAFGAALEWAARGPVAEADYDVTISARGGQLNAKVVQRRLPDRLAMMPRMQLALTGEPGRPPRTFDLKPVGPGAWSLEASVAAGSYGYTLTAAATMSGEGDTASPRLVRQGSLSTGPSAEYRGLGNNDRRLALLAEVGSGRVLLHPRDAAALVLPTVRRRALWPYLVMLAAVMVLYEVLRGFASRRE